MTLALIPYAKAKAAELGHHIKWETIGENIADGYCIRCGMRLMVAQPSDDLREVHGPAFDQVCPGAPDGAGT